MGKNGSKPPTSRSGDRVALNCVSAAITCFALVLGFYATAAAPAPAAAGGSFIQDINRISESLDRALFNILDDLQGPNYTAVNVTARYYSSDHFNPRGMAGLYNITNFFMDLLISKDIYPEGLLVINDGNVELGSIEEQWQSLATHFAGLLAVIIILVLLALLTPLVGFFFCCCRCCCGKCGAKPEPLDKKKDCCKKFFLATLLIASGTLLLFGVVCSFVTTQHMYEGGNELVPNVKTGVQDVDTYLNATGKEINILLNKNFGEFQGELFDVLNRSSNIVYEQLAKYSNAVAMTQVSLIVDGLGDIKSNLTQMRNITFYLRNHASQLNDALRKVKRDLIHTLNTCTQNEECSRLSSNVSKLDTNIDFNSLPDVTTELKELEQVMNGNIADSVAEGQRRLEEIEVQINKTVSSSLDAVRTAVVEAGTHITASVSNVTSVLNEISTTIHDNTRTPLNQADRYVRDFLPYGYYVAIGVSCVLLAIVLCIALGLICGICGKKPDHYNDDCCNKGVGSRCLMSGVSIMFLSAIFLAAVTIILFALGVLGQRLVCDSMRNYEDSRVVDLIDENVNLQEAIGIDLTIKHVLSTCHRNESAYTVFKLEAKFDLNKITNYFEEYDIQKALDELQSNINVPVDVEILSTDAKRKLQELAKSNVSNINFDRFTAVLDHNLTKVDLNYLVQQLDLVIEAVKRHSVSDDILANLQNSRLHLETYQNRLVDPMTANARNLIDIADNMEHNLKFGKSSFEEAINDLIDEVEKAEVYLVNNGSQLLKEIAVNFTMAIKGQVDDYVKRVVHNVEFKVGRCGPLSKVINATLTSACDQILLPMNGLWFVIFWSLLLFIVIIVLSVKLASLYQKFDQYSFPGESEYLYDAYADREIIPLASAKPSKKKKKNKKYEGRGGGNYTPETGDHPGARREYASSSTQDARYADMAPRQHWEEFPNGGPPQYQRAPTEYERPPPYNYYPGASGEQ